jgi:predicted nucleotidyltransferase
VAEFEKVLERLIKTLQSASLQYVIVGGLAAIMNGSARTTSDIDVIVESQPNIAEKIISAFTAGGFEVMEEQVRNAIREGLNASIFAPNSVIRVDLKVARKPDEIEVLNHSIEEELNGLKFKIASIEQILYGKILYLGDISDLAEGELLEYNDVKDFVNVFNTAVSLDIEWLKNKAQQRGLSQTLNRLIKKAKEEQTKI